MNFGFTSTSINISGLNFKGAWNADTNSPFLQSGVGVAGDYYIVSVAGTTNLDGVNDWQIGDWAIFEGATNMWQKIDNHDIVSYNTIQEEGVSLPQQNVLDFVGGGVTATNGIGKTIVTIPIQPAYSTVQDEGISLPQRQIIDFQGLGVQATDFGGKTVVTILQGLPATSYGLYSQIQNSTPITATTIESTLIGLGVGTLSVPANQFFVGGSFRADFGGVMSAKNSDSIRIRIKSGAVILADSGNLTMPTITNQVWSLSINFTIRSVGGAGVASIVTLANLLVLKLAGANQEGFAWNFVNNTTFDTTVPNTLDVTAQWSSNSAINSIYSDIFVLNKIY